MEDKKFPAKFFLLLNQNKSASDYFYSLPDFQKNKIFYKVREQSSPNFMSQAIQFLCKKDLSFFD